MFEMVCSLCWIMQEQLVAVKEFQSEVHAYQPELEAAESANQVQRHCDFNPYISLAP